MEKATKLKIIESQKGNVTFSLGCYLKLLTRGNQGYFWPSELCLPPSAAPSPAGHYHYQAGDFSGLILISETSLLTDILPSSIIFLFLAVPVPNFSCRNATEICHANVFGVKPWSVSGFYRPPTFQRIFPNHMGASPPPFHCLVVTARVTCLGVFCTKCLCV